MTNHLNLPETAEHGSDERMFAPYAERNKTPIFDVLNEVFPENADVLEIASGTGQHCDCPDMPRVSYLRTASSDEQARHSVLSCDTWV